MYAADKKWSQSKKDSVYLFKNVFLATSAKMCIRNYDIESLAIEMENKRSKIIVLNIIDRKQNKDLRVREN